MRTLMLVLVGCIALAGCATTPRVVDEIPRPQLKIQIPPNNSLLYVVRPFSYSASANRYKISINETHVANIANGTYFSYLVPSGDVHVSAETVPNFLNFGLALAFMRKPKLTLMTTPGKVYFINVGVSFSGGPTLTNVESKVGESLIKKTRKIETLKNK